MASNRPPEWEYRVVEPPREPSQKEACDPTGLLNEVADDGWELDETIDYVGGGTKFFIFRRPTSEADTESHHE
ncbi:MULTISPECIES: hypothetical protein [Halorussus]|uniref:hypothetical protein n=1 Tax=Halorussus TaxID=1070314 RepID=UPI000E212EA8|nr:MULTISPECIES: hypothetical protein [Halorussus]NHN59380.1 hypothetical protein [Halorussus sp. JP-T4]